MRERRASAQGLVERETLPIPSLEKWDHALWAASAKENLHLWCGGRRSIVDADAFGVSISLWVTALYPVFVVESMDPDAMPFPYEWVGCGSKFHKQAPNASGDDDDKSTRMVGPRTSTSCSTGLVDFVLHEASSL